MKKKMYRSMYPYMVVGITLLVNACSLPNSNPVAINSTSTPTASNSAVDETAIATSLPEADSGSPTGPEAQSFNVCGFFTAADAEPIVGTALIDVTQGSDVDDVTGGSMSYCTYKGDDVALVLSIVTSYAARDSAEWQGQVAEMLGGPDAVSPDSVAGLGEQASWMVLENAAGWNVAKYPYVFALVVGGNIGYSEDYKEDLTTLAHRVVDGLP